MLEGRYGQARVSVTQQHSRDKLDYNNPFSSELPPQLFFLIKASPLILFILHYFFFYGERVLHAPARSEQEYKRKKTNNR